MSPLGLLHLIGKRHRCLPLVSRPRVPAPPKKPSDCRPHTRVPDPDQGNDDSMRIPLPGPSALIGGATAAAEAVETAIGLVPRMAAALTRMEGLLDRTEALLTHAESSASAVEQVAVQANAVVTRAEKVSARSDAAVKVIEIVARDAGRTVDGATGILHRADTMLSTWEPILRTAAPSARRLASSISPAEVQAAITLVDQLPVLLTHDKEDVLPILATLDRVGPDIHELLATAEDLRRVLTGLPGIGFLRKRGDDEPASHDEDKQDDR